MCKPSAPKCLLSHNPWYRKITFWAFCVCAPSWYLSTITIVYIRTLPIGAGEMRKNSMYSLTFTETTEKCILHYYLSHFQWQRPKPYKCKSRKINIAVNRHTLLSTTEHPVTLSHCRKLQHTSELAIFKFNVIQTFTCFSSTSYNIWIAIRKNHQGLHDVFVNGSVFGSLTFGSKRTF